MILNECKGDLFELDNSKYVYVHCISLDAEMGKGIAVEFDKRFKGMKKFLINKIKAYDLDFPISIPCFKNEKLLVFNLITKKNYWGKPTYETISKCIEQMVEQCERHEVKYLAMPKIGCGLDRLQWERVKQILFEKFKDSDITIEVRYL